MCNSLSLIPQTVQEKDIKVKVPNPKEKDSTENGGSEHGNSENRLMDPQSMIAAGTLVVLDEEMGGVVPLPPQEDIDHATLTLPSDAANGARCVPGGCAICLCPYENGDQVSWSKEVACQHVFHQECIVPWLAKKEEPKCPCCRQDFCVFEPLTPADLSALAGAGTFTTAGHHHLSHPVANPMSPFGLIPASLIGLERPALNPSATTVSPDLTASQIVTEEGVVSFASLGSSPTATPLEPNRSTLNSTTSLNNTSTTANRVGLNQVDTPSAEGSVSVNGNGLANENSETSTNPNPSSSVAVMTEVEAAPPDVLEVSTTPTTTTRAATPGQVVEEGAAMDDRH